MNTRRMVEEVLMWASCQRTSNRSGESCSAWLQRWCTLSPTGEGFRTSQMSEVALRFSDMRSVAGRLRLFGPRPQPSSQLTRLWGCILDQHRCASWRYIVAEGEGDSCTKEGIVLLAWPEKPLVCWRTCNVGVLRQASKSTNLSHHLCPPC